MRPETPHADAHRTIGLDIPRALAISVVVLSHVGGLSFQPFGFFGVELFFALSGFLIGSILYREFTASPRWSMADIRVFWARRWWRTLPNYYLFLLISIPFHYAFGGLPTWDQFLRYLVFTQNLMNSENAFYGVSWSLAIEEWFYLLFPVALLLFSRCGASKRVSFLLSTTVFLVVPILIREMLLPNTAADSVRHMTMPRLDAVFYGVAVAFCVSKYPLSDRVRLGALVAGLALVAPFAVLFALGHDSTAVWRMMFVAVPLGFALCMPWLKTVHAFPRGLAPLGAWVRSISLWSYSIYLMHIPVLFTVYALFGESRQRAVVNLASKALAVVVCVVLSKLVYEQFERRLTRRRPEVRIAPVDSRTIAA